jgi:hypothetical protein
MSASRLLARRRSVSGRLESMSCLRLRIPAPASRRRSSHLRPLFHHQASRHWPGTFARARHRHRARWRDRRREYARRRHRRRAALRQELRAPGRSLGFFGEVANIVEGKYPISYDLRSRSNMGIFLAGATSVVGIRLLPFMLADGYVIAAMTRTQGKAP